MASPPLTKIDHCGRRRLRLLRHRGNMNILVRAAVVFAIVAFYSVLDARLGISATVRRIFLGDEHPYHQDFDYQDYYD